MSMTRGEFLKTLTVGAGSAMVGLTGSRDSIAAPADGVPGCGERSRQVLEDMDKEVFAKYLHTRFRICDKLSPTVIEAELVQVDEGGSSNEVEHFSLLFTGPAEPRLGQQTYGIEHPEMGSFDLFLVPVGADENRTSYEAVFNRLHRKPADG